MTEKLLEQISTDFQLYITKLLKNVHRGRISQSEMNECIRSMQYKMLRELELSDQLCHKSLEELTEEQWLRMKTDYELWERGENCHSEVGDEWIIVKADKELTSLERIKKEFFDMRRALCLGIAEFMPIPQSIERSAIGIPYHYDTLRCMEFASEDINSLFGEQQSIIGRVYSFVQEDGIELRIRVVGVQKNDDHEKTVLTCKGYVTEYMLPIDHDIEIDHCFKNNSNNPIIWFRYLSDEDLQCFYNSQRFKPYIMFRESREKLAIDESMMLINNVYAQ